MTFQTKNRPFSQNCLEGILFHFIFVSEIFFLFFESGVLCFNQNVINPDS